MSEEPERWRAASSQGLWGVLVRAGAKNFGVFRDMFPNQNREMPYIRHFISARKLPLIGGAKGGFALVTPMRGVRPGIGVYMWDSCLLHRYQAG